MVKKILNVGGIADEIPILKRYKVNSKGRDFVVGDIHGCYDIFMQLLDHVKFDKSKDRVFSVGDLIDRGPDSLKCLQLLDESWFAAVVANHESFMLDYAKTKRNEFLWIQNGGMWAATYINDYPHPSQEYTDQDSWPFWNELLPLVKQMPMMITVTAKNRKKFHLVHAEFGYEGVISDKKLLDKSFVKKIWVGENRGYSYGEYDGIWCRNKFQYFRGNEKILIDENQRYFSELSTVYSGHTIQDSGKAAKIGPWVCLDTGSFLYRKEFYGITMIEHETGKTWLSNAFGVRETKMNVVC